MSLVSLYDAASLWMTPSGAEDGKLFSQLPTDGSGDFTFSRGSNLAATRVGADGLIEKGRENLLLQSNNFSPTPPWVKSNTSVTGGHSGYDGSSNAWKLIQNTTNTFHFIYQNVSTTSICTYSIYAKAGEYSGISFFFPNVAGTSSASTFNLLTGTFVTNAHNATSEDVGGGWYRVSLLSKPSGTQSFNTYVNQTTQGQEAGDGTSGIYIQDAQLEIGLAATDYIESGATTGKAGLLEDEPRFDYSGGATCPSLLLEPSRTNLIDYSEYLGNILSGNRMDINDLVDASPEGLVNASKLVPDTTPNSTHQSNGFNYGSFVSGDKITISIFAKADGFSGIILRFLNSSGAFTTNRLAKFDLSRGRWENASMDGTTGVMEGAVGMEFLGNGWYRCYATATADASGDVDIRIPLADVTAEDVYDEVFTGDGTKGILIYGLQIEQGSYPTSYIPNHSGGSVTRGADVTDRGSNLSYTGDYTLFMEFNLTEDAAYILNATTLSTWSMYIEGSFAGFQFGRTGGDSGSLSFASSFDWSAAIGTNVKIALVKNGTSAAMFVNGTKYTPSSNTLSTGNEVLDWRYLNYTATTTRHKQNYIKQLLEFEEALSDAECIALTQL